MKHFYGTTIISARRGNIVSLGCDGQVTLGNTIAKSTASKIRKLYKGQVLVGFAGSTVDAFTLLNLFESNIEKYQGNLLRSSVELAKKWRNEYPLRRLEAMLLVVNRISTLLITGNGDILEPVNGVGAIGSGSVFAQSAALALQENTNLSPFEIVKKSLIIAGELCIYTNLSHTIETLD